MQVLRKIMISCLIITIGVGGWLYYYAMSPRHFSPPRQVFLIEVGQTSSQVTAMLAQKQLIKQPFWFLMLARILHKTKKIKAGSYEIHSPMSAYQLLNKITNGDGQSSTLRIIEGWRWADIRKVLMNDPHLRHDINTMTDKQILHILGVTEDHIEGIFFPDTYHYTKGSSDLMVLKRAYQQMTKHLRQAWEARLVDLPLDSPYALLIMASIIEKETAKAEDRQLIAGVFMNRLRLGMRLQTDPTVIYGMGERYKGNIRKVDLKTDTTYNTYTRAGLPPSPIAMPGRASLYAAAQPAKTRALYFVAKGNGGSYFSETLFEHNHAINHYVRKGRR